MPTKTQFDLVVIGTGSAATRMAERTTPVLAAIAALSTLACCLPLSFLAAVGLAGASARLQSFRPWLLGSGAVLLGIGFIQLYLRHNQCQKRSPFLYKLQEETYHEPNR